MRSLAFAMALCLSATAALAQDIPDKVDKSESNKRYNEIVTRHLGAFTLELTKEQFDKMVRGMPQRKLEPLPPIDCTITDCRE